MTQHDTPTRATSASTRWARRSTGMRRGVAVVLTAVAVSMVALVAAPTPAGAVDGLSIASNHTFSINTTTGAVTVEATYTIANTLSNTRRGNTISQPYFSGFRVPIVSANFGVSAEQNGQPLAVSIIDDPESRAYAAADVEFARNLFAKKTITVIVRYDIIGALPRSRNVVRATPAFVAFPVFGLGDPGKVSAQVVVPPGWTVDDISEDMNKTEAFGNTIYSLDNIAEPDDTTAFFLASKPDQLAKASATDSDGNSYEIRSWPVDAEWATFVKEQVAEVPTLSELIGQEWPVRGTLRVIETVTPSLSGYAGQFNLASNEIHIGEDLDQPTMLHELTHAWFRDRWFDERWVREGLAETYASLLMTEIGGTPLGPSPVSTSDEGYVALNRWTEAAQADETEEFAYNASFLVVKTIVDEIGVEKMRAVIDAVAKGKAVYGRVPGESGAAGAVAIQTDWRRFLDLVEVVGGSKSAAKLFENRVVARTDLDDLETRAELRARYVAAQESAGDWPLPIDLRREMEGWGWPNADILLDDTEGALAVRAELVAAAKEAGEEVPTEFAERFEAALHSTFPALIADMRAAIDELSEPTVPGTVAPAATVATTG